VAVADASDFLIALVRLQRQLRARSGRTMTPTQSSALARVDSEGPLRLGALAELEGTTAATMSRVVETLVSRGWVERVADPLDGRAIIVQVSTEGAHLLESLRAESSDAIRAAMATLTPEEYATIVDSTRVLERLSELVQASLRSPLR
jgi:DNA-binding MarR family transcriptional regulator